MNQKELLRKLYERGSTGCDLSPGDMVCIEAYHEIKRLQSRLENVATYTFTQRDHVDPVQQRYQK